MKSYAIEIKMFILSLVMNHQLPYITSKSVSVIEIGLKVVDNIFIFE